MNAKTTEQKTAVFTPCAESMEATRAFPVLDEDTRELPLIADRFAGRYWDGRMEKETDETGGKPARKKTWRSALAFGAAAVAAMLLFVGSLTGQAELTAMNDEPSPCRRVSRRLKAEERTLLVETEKAESLAAVESYAVGTLGMEPAPARSAQYRRIRAFRPGHGAPRAPRTGAAVFLGEPSRHGYGMF